MKGLTHIACGAAVGLATSTIVSNGEPIIGVAMSILGAIIVDLDSKDSKINKYLFLGLPGIWRNIIKLTIGSLAFFTLNEPLLRFIGAILILSVLSERVSLRLEGFAIKKYTYHRWIFHDPVIGAVLLHIPLIMLGVPIYYITYYTMGMFFGHYLIDAFNPYGLPCILTKRNIRTRIINFDTQKPYGDVLVGGSLFALSIGIYFFNI